MQVHFEGRGSLQLLWGSSARSGSTSGEEAPRHVKAWVGAPPQGNSRIRLPAVLIGIKWTTTEEPVVWVSICKEDRDYWWAELAPP